MPEPPSLVILSKQTEKFSGKIRQHVLLPGAPYVSKPSLKIISVWITHGPISDVSPFTAVAVAANTPTALPPFDKVTEKWPWPLASVDKLPCPT